ncbi:MAG: hypothetical protein COY81_02470 [Candidatus Pacebacteria bacterium CG_4_10_14_0_8_um_filter_43_12]|nr:MAG: hypothetical protein COY81_02470 [Candidatus Pacebacteria bacterium CG_4_10_14_0_8_um_filter_43_12]
MAKTLPADLEKYFWGDDLSELSWPVHKKYIVQTLLNKADLDGLKWLFGVSSREEIKQMLPSLKLDKKSRNFWQVYLS